MMSVRMRIHRYHERLFFSSLWPTSPMISYFLILRSSETFQLICLQPDFNYTTFKDVVMKILSCRKDIPLSN